MAYIKRILITGATGGLGYATYEYLQNKGYELIPTGRTIKPHQKFTNFIPLDLSSVTLEELKKKVGKVDYIVHCAALATDNDLPEDYWLHNVYPTVTLKQFAHMVRAKKFIYISSPSIYFNGYDRYNVKEDSEIDKSTISPYAQSKLEAEKEVLRPYKNITQENNLLPKNKVYEHLVNIILRPRAIFGQHDTVLLPKLLEVLNKPLALLPKAGHVLQDFTYVENVAHAIYCAIENKVPNNSIFNITNQEPWYLDDVLKKIMAHYNIKPYIMNMPNFIHKLVGYLEKKSYSRNEHKKLKVTTHGLNSISRDMVLDNENAIKVLKYKPIVGMRDSLEKTLNSIKPKTDISIDK